MGLAVIRDAFAVLHCSCADGLGVFLCSCRFVNMQKDAVKAVSAALEAPDVPGALANVDITMRYPAEAAANVPLAAIPVLQPPEPPKVKATAPPVPSRLPWLPCDRFT